MAIRRIRAVPHYLPHARLYIDDVEEISKILTEASARLSAEPTIVRYRTKDREMDSIDDLLTLGGSTTKFVIDTGLATVSLNGIGRPLIFMSPEVGNEYAWVIYGKIREIFYSRRIKRRSAVPRPDWLLAPLLMALGALSVQRESRPLIAVALLCFFGMFLFSELRPSRVYFVRSHDKEKAAVSERRIWARDVVMIALGALIPIVLRYVAISLSTLKR